MNKNWRYRLGRSFFGLSDKYSQQLYEQIFLMKHYGGWSFIEVYNLPIGLRHWFYERLVKQYEEENKAAEEARKKAR